jgi:hypothetical protein
MASVNIAKASAAAAGILMLVGCFGSGDEEGLSIGEYYDSLEVQAEQNAEDAKEWELERADRQNAWADTYLAAEKAEALYWRQTLAKRDPVSNKPMGELVNMTTREVVRYPCDPNYDRAQPGGCAPGDRDYECWELRSWGIVNIPIKNFSSAIATELKGDDWMLLDDDHGGVGCEFYPAE